MVGAVEVQADDDVLRAGVHGGVHRAEGFGQDGAGASVQEPVWLGVAGNRHRPHDPIRAGFEQFDTHLLGEGSHAEGG